MEYTPILLDLETQRDFFCPGGSCYNRGATRVAERIARLFAWARREHIPVISTLLRVRRGRFGPLAGVPHCVDGTDGERKVSRMLLARRRNFGLRNSTDLSPDIFAEVQQVIFEKRHTDIFRHARIERLITMLGRADFVICGAGVAGGILQAAIGLRHRGAGVIVAADAVLDLDDPDAVMAYERMHAKGVLLVPTERIVAPLPPRTTLRSSDATPLRSTSRRARPVAPPPRRDKVAAVRYASGSVAARRQRCR